VTIAARPRGPGQARKRGVYCEDSDISVLLQSREGESGLGDALGVGGVYPHAVEPEPAERLWALSEELTGVCRPAHGNRRQCRLSADFR
jgi:hypothetical protein